MEEKKEQPNGSPNGKEVLKGAINLVKETQAGRNYECNLCKDGTPHLMVVLSKTGEMHVHAPFSNKYMMNEFMEAIIEEQKRYNQNKIL